MHAWAELRDSGWPAGRVSEFKSFSTTKSTCFIPWDGVFAFQGVPGGINFALYPHTLYVHDDLGLIKRAEVF